MRPPVAEPPFLQHRPLEPGIAPCGSETFVFDVATQSAAGAPDFEGVRVFQDFVSEAEAVQLLAEIERTPFAPAQSGKQKQHFGPRMNFRKRKMNAKGFDGLPRYAHWLEARLRVRAADAGLRAALVPWVTTDAFVLRYLEAECSNLDPHVDDLWAYGELIVDLSLESDGWLTFLDRDPQDGIDGAFRCVRVPAPARSLVALFGAARTRWCHGVSYRDIEGRRTSITLRTLGHAVRETVEGAAVLERAGRALPAPPPVSLEPEKRGGIAGR